MKTELATRGSGVAVRKLTPQPDGSTLAHISVDLSQLPVPDRSYVADLSGVYGNSEQAHLLFGQERFGKKGLRSLIVVSMFHDAVHTFLKTITDGTFEQSLGGFRNSHSVVPPTGLVPPDEDPPHVVTLRANLVAASFSGPAAELQFFHLTPISVHKLARDKAVSNIEPVVRVDLSAGMLFSMIKQLQELAVAFPQESR